MIGRTNAWQGNYEQAESDFQKVLEDDPTYKDAYNAYADNEFWQGDYETALQIVDQGLEHHPKNEAFLERKIKILGQLGRKANAQKIYEDLKSLDIDSNKLQKLNNYIRE
ncbi:MAG: tetratricopeptide repeat protein [Aliifodinibius sp.]|nr:tetratricopeptide repeat protein [Fodinibius sp.]NIV16013.1 tetratricopeptide repeat protein [Fodinibius sp.]NIY25461.1 tetratricopeptide repeat protein [Fodinibius sp.]